jgi:hypothetical protein
MDHNEAVRKFNHLMLREANNARKAATELEALISLLPSETRPISLPQGNANHKLARDFRERAQKVKESQISLSFAVDIHS